MKSVTSPFRHRLLSCVLVACAIASIDATAGRASAQDVSAGLDKDRTEPFSGSCASDGTLVSAEFPYPSAVTGALHRLEISGEPATSVSIDGKRHVIAASGLLSIALPAKAPATGRNEPAMIEITAGGCISVAVMVV